MDLKEVMAGKLGVFLSHVEKIYTRTLGEMWYVPDPSRGDPGNIPLPDHQKTLLPSRPLQDRGSCSTGSWNSNLLLDKQVLIIDSVSYTLIDLLMFCDPSGHLEKKRI